MSYNLLKGKRGIIFGALNDQSIAWKVAERAVEEGATITLSNTPMAIRMGEVNALAEKLNCQIVPADATSVEDLSNVFKTSMDILGGQIDFVLHSIGMSPNVRKKRTYDDLDYGMLDKTLDISAVSFHKMIQSAKKLNAIADYGSIVALSYVAAQRTFYGYNDMADAKALLESIARSFGYICPACGKANFHTRSVFALTAAAARMECECGREALEVQTDGTKFRLWVPCGVCGGHHQAECSADALLHGRGIGLSCPVKQDLCCYVGREQEVRRAMENLALRVEKDKGTDGEAFTDNVIMYEVLSELKDIAARGGIACTCGSSSHASSYGCCCSGSSGCSSCSYCGSCGQYNGSRNHWMTCAAA